MPHRINEEDPNRVFAHKLILGICAAGGLIFLQGWVVPVSLALGFLFYEQISKALSQAVRATFPLFDKLAELPPFKAFLAFLEDDSSVKQLASPPIKIAPDMYIQLGVTHSEPTKNSVEFQRYLEAAYKYNRRHLTDKQAQRRLSLPPISTQSVENSIDRSVVPTL